MNWSIAQDWWSVATHELNHIRSFFRRLHSTVEKFKFWQPNDPPFLSEDAAKAALEMYLLAVNGVISEHELLESDHDQKGNFGTPLSAEGFNKFQTKEEKLSEIEKSRNEQLENLKEIYPY